MNNVDENELKQAKEKMNQTFDKNSLKPGDVGYKYEVEKEFQPKNISDWDDD